MKSIVNVWDEIYLNTMYQKYPEEDAVRWIFAHAKKAFFKGAKALDIGCGTGRHASVLADAGFDVTGCDISKEGVKIAKDLLKARSFKASFYVASLPDLFFEDESFEVVFCSGMLNYLSPKGFVKSIKEIFRVLKGGGLAYIKTRDVNSSFFKDKISDIEGFVGVRTSDSLEAGLKNTFFSYEKADELFKDFTSYEINTNATTHQNGSFLDSNAIIYLKK